MAAHVIVLANRTAPAPELIEALVERRQARADHRDARDAGRRPGSADRAVARERMEEALDAWRAAGIETCDGVVCDPVPLEALERGVGPDAPRRGDRVHAPGPSSKWIRGDLPHSVARFTGVPVTHIVTHDREPDLVGPPPAHEKAPLGPLSVLAWGKRSA